MMHDENFFNRRENAVEFPYEELDKVEKPQSKMSIASDYLSTIFHFANMSPDPKARHARWEVMLFEVNPALSPYSSYENLAAGLETGVSKQYVHKLAVQFRELTGFRSQNEISGK